jgi:hypothetical protein
MCPCLSIHSSHTQFESGGTEENYGKPLSGYPAFWPRFHASTLKMEVICSSETSIGFQRTTLYYIPEDSALHSFFFLFCYFLSCVCMQSIDILYEAYDLKFSSTITDKFLNS